VTPQQEREHLLREATLVVEGVLRDASNLTLRVLLQVGSESAESSPAESPSIASSPGEDDGEQLRAVYKPMRGERPLHDFPAGSLAGREVAAYLISAAGSWDLVPPTVLRDGPLGPGSVQWWIDQPEDVLATPWAGVVDVVRPREVRPGWLPVVQAEDADGEPLVVVHADEAAVASLAVLDCVLNNADRKGSHLLRDDDGRLWGIDHGIGLHVDDKLRTVLWGWAGHQLPQADAARLAVLEQRLATDPELKAELGAVITTVEVSALLCRVRNLLENGTFPRPPGDRYPLPWPLW
jgi:uncharacterized repeat protein (TIGR03843 family)